MVLVNLEQTTNCIHSIGEILLVLAKNYLCLFIPNNLMKTHYQCCHFIFSQFVIVKHNSVKKCGLASVFSVTCAVCGTEDVVKTSSEHRSGLRGPPSHKVNSRAVLGFLNTGIGETHLSNLLCTLNIPYMNPVAFKSRKNAVEQVTKKKVAIL